MILIKYCIEAADSKEPALIPFFKGSSLLLVELAQLACRTKLICQEIPWR